MNRTSQFNLWRLRFYKKGLLLATSLIALLTLSFAAAGTEADFTALPAKGKPPEVFEREVQQCMQGRQLTIRREQERYFACILRFGNLIKIWNGKVLISESANAVSDNPLRYRERRPGIQLVPKGQEELFTGEIASDIEYRSSKEHEILYRKADNDDVPSLLILAKEALVGSSISPANPTIAARLFARAAQKGNAEAMMQLADMYRKGLGVTRDLNAVREFYTLVAGTDGHPAETMRAQYELGTLYERCEGVACDPELAKTWYLKAEANGYSLPAGNMISRERAIKELIAKADGGDLAAQMQLAVAYEIGRGVANDLSLSAKYYLLAAQQGSMEAKYRLAGFYRQGVGVTQDYKTALKFYTEVAKSETHPADGPSAQFETGVFYEQCLGVPCNLKTAKYWYALAETNGYTLPKDNPLIKERKLQEARKQELDRIKDAELAENTQREKAAQFIRKLLAAKKNAGDTVCNEDGTLLGTVTKVNGDFLQIKIAQSAVRFDGSSGGWKDSNLISFNKVIVCQR